MNTTSMTTESMNTWFVTGTSRGLGRELVAQLLERGANVAATTRSTDRLLAALDGVDTANLLPLELDLTDGAAVDAAVRRTTERFGGLDVVVNNAGYGFLAPVEETTDAEARRMFDVQLFGLWNVLRATLPILRTQGHGHVVNVSSILGLTAMPGWGLYCAGKFALEGLTQALAGELREFGVDVSLVEPGYFRTDFLTRDSLELPSAATDAYPAIAQMTRDHLALQGSQLGDPRKGAAAIIEIATGTGGRLHNLLGSDSFAFATAAVAALAGDIEGGRDLAHTTDF